MSCITEILKIKGDKEILKIPNHTTVIEHGGSYEGYEYLITLNDRGTRCGYVAISPQHQTYNFHNKEYNYPDFEVHGGVTFFDKSHLAEDILGYICDDKWIGFDAGHGYDVPDTENVKKYFRKSKIAREYLMALGNSVESIVKGYHHEDENEPKLRTKEYMEQECKSLIEQLIEKEKEIIT